MPAKLCGPKCQLDQQAQADHVAPRTAFAGVRIASRRPENDRAEQDATQLVGLLFVAATPLRRTQVAETLKVSQGRLARACAVLQADPPRGLRLQEAGDTLGLVSGPECSDTVERHLGQPVPEALSQAALDTLAIIAYEQPLPAPTSAASAVSTATRWSRPFERADWLPRTPALVAAAGPAFSSLRLGSCSTSG